MTKNIALTAFLAGVLFLPLAQAEDLALCLKGYSAHQAKEYDKAISLYDQCVKVGALSNGALAMTYRNYAGAYRAMGKPDKAIGFNGKAIALKPDDVWNDYSNRGNSFADMGRFKEALADFAKAIALKPDFALAYYNRGTVYERQKLPGKAKKEFLEAYRQGLRSEELDERFIVHGLKPGDAAKTK